jgi:hypothetical protein
MNSIDSTLVLVLDEGDYDAVNRCIDEGANVHMHCEWPLRRCAYLGKASMAQLLIERGADYEKALDILWRDGSYECIALLVNVACPEESLS